MGSLNKRLIKEYNKDEMHNLIMKEIDNYNHEVRVQLRGIQKGQYFEIERNDENNKVKDHEIVNNSSLAALSDVTNNQGIKKDDVEDNNKTQNGKLTFIDVKNLKIPVQEGKLWIKKSVQVLNVCFKNIDFCK